MQTTEEEAQSSQSEPTTEQIKTPPGSQEETHSPEWQAQEKQRKDFLYAQARRTAEKMESYGKRGPGLFASLSDQLSRLFARPTSSPTPQEPAGGGKTKEGETKERSAIEKMRDKIADFDEDYKDIGERVLGAFAQLVGYVGPFAFVLWVGSDLGRFFTATMGTIPAFGLSYTIECVIAACTVSMGRAFAEIASGKPNWGKASMVVLIWLVLNASSAFALYLVITNGGQVAPGIDQTSMIVRVCAIAMGDLGCSAVLMFKGRSIQKHIESIKKRATAIGELADAQRSIEEADKNAALREQMMKATLQIQEDLSQKIGEAVSMVMSSILEKMEKALKDEGKGERGYGKR